MTDARYRSNRAASDGSRPAPVADIGTMEGVIDVMNAGGGTFSLYEWDATGRHPEIAAFRVPAPVVAFTVTRRLDRHRRAPFRPRPARRAGASAPRRNC